MSHQRTRLRCGSALNRTKHAVMTVLWERPRRRGNGVRPTTLVTASDMAEGSGKEGWLHCTAGVATAGTEGWVHQARLHRKLHRKLKTGAQLDIFAIVVNDLIYIDSTCNCVSGCWHWKDVNIDGREIGKMATGYRHLSFATEP